MKRKNLIFCGSALAVCLFLMCFCCQESMAQGRSVTKEYTTSGSTTFTVPFGVTEIDVQAWGAGGAGGTATGSSSAAGGGGGGGYAQATLSNLTPGSIIYITVGAGGIVSTSPNGGASGVALSEGGQLVVKAAGGLAGSSVSSGSSAGQGGVGGNDNVGDVTRVGGNGGNGYQSNFAGFYSQHGGGGGGAAGIYKNGASGSSPYAGGNGGSVSIGSTSRQTTTGKGHAYNSSITGNGANGGFTYKPWLGGSSDDATAASSFGGGGGGATRHNNSYKSSASNGANGAVFITYNECATEIKAGEIRQNDYVCHEADTLRRFETKTAASPTGGTYQWYISDNGTSGWTKINGATSESFIPKNTGLKYYYREYVTPCGNVNSNVLFAFHPGNVVLASYNVNKHLICSNADDKTVTLSYDYMSGIEIGSGANYTFQWQKSTDGGNTWISVDYEDEDGYPATIEITETTQVRYAILIDGCDADDPAAWNYADVQTIVYETVPEVEVTVTSDKCPLQEAYTLQATATPAGSYLYKFNGDAEGSTNNTYLLTGSKECGKTYSVPYEVVNNRCAATGTFEFTVETPALTFNSLSPMNAICQDGKFVLPSEEDITKFVLSQYTGTCAEGLSIVSITPAPGTAVEAATDLTVTVKHDCVSGTKDLALTVNVVTFSVAITATNNITTLCGGTETELTATVTPNDVGGSFAWTKNATAAGTSNPLSITADAVGTATYHVDYTASTGCISTAEIEIITVEAPMVKDTIVKEPICHAFSLVPDSRANTTGAVLSGVTYSWEAPAVTGITGLSAGTNKTLVSDDVMDNENTATTDVVYTVTPSYGSCTGDNFTVTVSVKPNIKHHEFTTLNFQNSDIVLYYGACDSVYQYENPEYVTPVTEYQDLLKITHSNLPVPVTPGEYKITWTFTDPCGNTRTEEQTVTVSFPPCGDGFTAKDADGNEYATVRIGCECWLAENLKTTKYSDNTEVPVANVYVNDQYPDEAANLEKFGRLYSWYSAVKVAENDNEAVPATTTGVNDVFVQGVCPEGWGLPEEADYQNMMTILGNAARAKTTDASAWLPGAEGVAPETFNAFGAGYYDKAADMYVSLLGETYFWTSEKVTSTKSACMCVAHYCPRAIFTDVQNGRGLSVRCIKKEMPIPVR